MTNKEFSRLRNMWQAQRNKPYTTSIGRRHAKGKGLAVGQVLKKSRVQPQVSINRYFKPFN